MTDSIEDFCISEGNICAISSKGELYEWGANSKLSGDKIAPLKVDFNDFKLEKEKISNIWKTYCTYENLESVVRMWSFVKTGKKQFHIEQSDDFTKIQTSLKLFSIDEVWVHKVACSAKHTLICTNTGAVYGWGDNSFF